MKVRELAALLRALQASGVTRYEDGALKIELGAPAVQWQAQPIPEEQVELPEGVMDPRQRIADIYRKHNKAAGDAQ